MSDWVATSLCEDCGCEGGGDTDNPIGTVKSVALTMPTGLDVAGSPVTEEGTLAVTTTITGLVKSDAGTNTLSTAVAGTDYEAPLGNPDEDGKVLASTAAGARSWVAPTQMPAGTDAQTIRFDGTTPVATSVIENDGETVTINPATITDNAGTAALITTHSVAPTGSSTARSWGLFGIAQAEAGATGDLTNSLPPLVGVEGRTNHSGNGTVGWAAGLLGYSIADSAGGSGARMVTEAVGVLAYGNRVSGNGVISNSYEMQATLKNAVHGGLPFTANDQRRVGLHLCGDVPSPGGFTGCLAAAIWFNSDVHGTRNGLTWGATAAERTNLYQSASQTLTTDGNLVVAGTLSALLGIDIEVLGADPVAPRAGQLWYRSDTDQLSIYTGSATKRVTFS